MSAIHDDQTQILTPPPGKPRKKWHQRWSVRIPALALAGLIGIIAASSGGSHPAPAAKTAPAPASSAPAAAPKSAAYPDQAADKALCATFNTDIKNGDTPSIQAALQQAGGSVSPGLAKDVQAVVDETGTVSQDTITQVHVAMDCGLVDAGKAPPAQGFSGSAAPAAAAPAATAPASSAPAQQAPASQPATAPAGPTVSQQQALSSAQGYLSDGQGFSRAGLIAQLDSPYGGQFSVADATWAADHAGADWNAQAVQAAKGYMSDGQGFSRQGLIDQLDSPYGGQFTQAQATYAVGRVGL
jgi:hypothetical protein